MKIKTLIILVSLTTMLCACGSKEETPVVTEVETTTVEEESTVEEIVEETTVEESTIEETTEESPKVEITRKYTNVEADVFANADETSEVLGSVGVNYAFSVIGVPDAFAEVIYSGGTAFVKSECLSDTMTEIIEEEPTVEEVVEEPVVEAPVVAEETTPSGELPQEVLDKMREMGFDVQKSSGEITHKAPVGTGDFTVDRPIVLH